MFKSLRASSLEMFPCCKMLCAEICRRSSRKRDFLSSAWHNKVWRTVKFTVLLIGICWKMPFRWQLSFVGHGFTLISAVSSTDVNGRGLVWLLEELKEGKKKKIKPKTENALWIYYTVFPMSLFFLIWYKTCFVSGMDEELNSSYSWLTLVGLQRNPLTYINVKAKQKTNWDMYI